MRLLPALAMTALLAAPAAARETMKGDITLVDPQIRASLGLPPNTAGYLTIRNRGSRPDRLLSASCACATRVELHTHRLERGVARMAKVAAIMTPARGQVVLAPGGAHLMFVGLRAPVVDGGDLPVTLVFERAGAVTVRFRARARIDAPSPARAHAH